MVEDPPCACQDGCHTFGDCCPDYDDVCGASSTTSALSCEAAAVDIVFVLDTSSSSEAVFADVREFAARLVARLVIAPTQAQ